MVHQPVFGSPLLCGQGGYSGLYQETALSNGVHVVTEALPHVRSLSIGFWFRAGSRDESTRQNGISHFIEHLMFKGTKTRSAREIAEVIDASGGQLNAFTSKEHTCYYARVLDQHLELATDVLADMLLNSAFSQVEIEKEKGVIIEEIKMYEDTPDERVHDLFMESVLGSHPLGKGVLGNADNIAGATRRDLLRFLQAHYTGPNLVVAVAGNLRHDEAVAQVESHFAGIKGTAAKKPVASPMGQIQGTTVIHNKDTEQVHLVLGVPGIHRGHPDRYALYLLDGVLGGGMSSRLFQELREERGLVYATFSYQACFEDAGIVGVYAGTSPQNAAEVLDLIHKELASVRSEGVTAAELQRAKEQMKGSLMLSLESTTARMSRLARAALYQERLLSPDELMARIDAVTADDLQRVAVDLLHPHRLTLAAIGPVPAELADEAARKNASASMEAAS